MGISYGYVRVSSAEQKERRQVQIFEEQGIPTERIFIDKISGKTFNRPQYTRLLKRLRPSDQLYITSLDRLGRNYEEILQQWALLTDKKKVDIIVLDMPLLDTRHKNDLLGQFISNIVLQILSFVAQIERENIHKRQAEGIAAAKKNGVRFGSQCKPLPDNFAEVYALWKVGEISAAEGARRTLMPRTSFRRRALLFEEQEKAL